MACALVEAGGEQAATVQPANGRAKRIITAPVEPQILFDIKARLEVSSPGSDGT